MMSVDDDEDEDERRARPFASFRAQARPETYFWKTVFFLSQLSARTCGPFNGGALLNFWCMFLFWFRLGLRVDEDLALDRWRGFAILRFYVCIKIFSKSRRGVDVEAEAGAENETESVVEC